MKAEKNKCFYAFIIANRNIPSAIPAPTRAPNIATIPWTIVPLKYNMLPAATEPSNPAPYRNTPNMINPMIINMAPTARLFPDPKYAVNAPAMKLAMANTSVNILRN